MSVVVITCGNEIESAERLGFRTTHVGGDYIKKYEKDIVVRWGNSTPAYSNDGTHHDEYAHVLNPAEYIRLNCNKLQSLKRLAMVVFVPAIYEKKVPTGTLAVIRPLEHAAGNGFNVVEGPYDVPRGTYGTRFLQTPTEYRVWFCGDQTMCGRREKMKINEEQKYPCRSNWGYVFSGGVSADLHRQTLLAAKTIGLDVGAADLLYYKGKYYFLELNSAPSVDHRVVREFFQASLDRLFRERFPKQYRNE
jgi:hypothetical protein